MKRVPLLCLGLAVACSGKTTNSQMPEPTPAGPVLSAGPVESFGVITPLKGALGRSVPVEILLEHVDVDVSTSIDFGPKIVVSRVEVTGPTSLKAMLTIDRDAPLGPRDVVVTAAGEQVVGHAAFTVVPTFDVKVSFPKNLDPNAPTVKQGGRIGFELTNEDPSVAFNFTNFDLEATGVNPLYVSSVRSGTFVAAGGVIAPKADVGPMALTAKNIYLDQTTDPFYGVAQVATIEARDAVEMTDAITDHPLVESGATDLYRYHIDGPFAGVVHVEISNDGKNPLWPAFWVYGDSGKSDDYLSYMAIGGFSGPRKVGPIEFPAIVTAPEDLYIIASDYTGGGMNGSSYDLSVSLTPLPSVTESADSASLPGQRLDACVKNQKLVRCVVSGEITAPGEVDIYRIEGLSTAAYMNVMLRTRGEGEIWGVDGALGKYDSVFSEVQGGDVYGNAYNTVRTPSVGAKVAGGSSWTMHTSWTLAVRGASTGRYAFSIWGQ